MARKKTRKKSSSAGSRSRGKNDKQLSQVIKDEIIGILLMGLACLGFVLMFTESNGSVGSRVMYVLRLISGNATVFIFLGIAVCGFWIMSRSSMPLGRRIVGITVFWMVLAGFMHLGLGIDATMDAALQGRGGGLIGGGLAVLLVKALGTGGSYVVLTVLGVIAFLLAFNRSIMQLCSLVGAKLVRGANRVGAQLSEFGSVVFGDGSRIAEDEAEIDRTKGKASKGKTRGKAAANKDADATAETMAQEGKSWPYQYFAGGYAPEPDGLDEVEVINFADDNTADGPSLLQDEIAAELAPAGQGISDAEAGAKGQGGSGRDGAQTDGAPEGESRNRASRQDTEGRRLVQSTPLSRQSIRGKAYKLPGLNLLHKPLKEKPGLNKGLTDSVKLLEETLANFGVTVKVVRVTQGPAITRFELQPAPGIKVSRITSLSDDIALALAASNVRIEAPIPGKSVVGIEVPNLEISPVHFREVIESSEYKNMPSKLTVALGKDISGNTIVGDLVKMPHLLIAGATGSGKSVCINSIICSVLFKACPDEVKMLLIDPKMVELINYNGAPHLVAPVVIDPQKAAGALKWMVTEMDSRYELFARAGVRDIVRYNFLAAEQEERDKHDGKQSGKDETVLVQSMQRLSEERAEADEDEDKWAADGRGSMKKEGAEPANSAAGGEGVPGTDEEETADEFSTGVLPYVIIIIDELADLMMVAPADVEDSICRLAQMARAAGIHLIVATQRPSVDVITGLIKANIPSRIAFAVSSQIDSRTILDMAGAEKLLGRGDMLYSNMSIAKPIRVQGCFLDDREVKNIVDFWKEQAIPKYLEIPAGNLKVMQNEEPEDELFYKAVQIIIDSNTASVSYLQRRLKIGYTRAARLMDSLEEKGVVGKSEGAKPREILMTRGVFEQRFGKWHDN